MIIRIRGYNSGFAEYLRTGKKAGSTLHRNELDKRVILHGDLDVTDKIVSSMNDNGKDRYLHITLSFKEDYISNELLNEVLDDFRKLIFNAYNEEEFAFYSEAHLPKVKGLLNESTGSMESRKPHIHIIIPKINLLDGSYLSPIGYYPHNERYIESIQETINTKYGLQSPRDNRRVNFTEISDFISRYKGDVFKSDSKGIKQELLTTILSTDDITYDSFINELKQQGTIRKRKGVSSEYLNFRRTGASKGVNLKEYFFSSEFISLSKTEKLDYIFSQVSTRTDEKKKQDELNDKVMLADWLNIRSHEIKYLHPNSKEFKLYTKMDNVSKEGYINRLIQSNETKLKTIVSKGTTISLNERLSQQLKEKYYVRRKDNDQKSRISNHVGGGTIRVYDQKGRIFPRDSMRELYSGPVDTVVFKETSLFLQAIAQPGMDSAGKRISNNLRLSVDRVDDGIRVNPINNIWEQKDKLIFKEITVSSPVRIADNHIESLREMIIDSGIAVSDMDKDKWKMIHKNINVETLLNALKHTHGLSSERYSISKGKDGTDRICCGNRNYSVNDFMTKELHFTWPEASEYILSEFKRQQSNGELLLNVTPSVDYWIEFRDWKLQPENSYPLLWSAFKSEQKNKRVQFHKEYRDQARGIWRDYPDLRARNAELARLKLGKIAAQEVFEREIEAERKIYRNSMSTRNRYIEFLQRRSEDGDSAALDELRRFTLKSKASVPDNGFIQHDHETTSIIYSDITFSVRKNGNVSYFIGRRFVVEDSREWVSVIDKNDEQAITLALKLALEKNGNRSLTLTGDSEFRIRVAAIAAQQQIRVAFNDEEAQKEYKRIITENSEIYDSEQTTSRRRKKSSK